MCMVDQKSGILALVGSSIAIFWAGAFVFGFPGVMAPYWKSAFHVGQGALGNIIFFVLAAVGILMFFVGHWQEKLGIRRMITIGATICGLDVLLIAFASNLYVVYLWAFLMGAASCFIYLPGLTTVQRWFPNRRGLVAGIFNMMFGISAAILSPVFGFLLTGIGYFSMTIALAAVALIVGIIAAQFTEAPREIPSPTGPKSVSPNQLVLEHVRSLTVRESIRTRSFWFLWATWALQGAAGISMVTLSAAYGMSKGFDLESAVVILTAFNLASGVSRFLCGYLSDLMDRNQVMSLTFFCSGAAYFALPYVESLLVLSVLAIVIGFAFGTLFAVSAPLAVDCFGILHFGAVFGLTYTAYGFVAGPLGPSLSGYILDATHGNYATVFSYLGAFCLISSVLIRFVTPPPLDHTLANE
jgi:OFA family oxalate/formate antiporter-like MFS transporter